MFDHSNEVLLAVHNGVQGDSNARLRLLAIRLAI